MLYLDLLNWTPHEISTVFTKMKLSKSIFYSPLCDGSVTSVTLSVSAVLAWVVCFTKLGFMRRANTCLLCTPEERNKISA